MVKLKIERVTEMNVDYGLMFGIDKQMHFFSYAVISMFIGIVIIFFSNEENVKQNISFIWFVLVVIGIVEEYRQYFVPNRSAEFLDAVANMFGVTLGLLLPLLISYVIRNRNDILFKRFALYSIVLVPLFLGLVYFNERPFITFEEPFQEQLKYLVMLFEF